MENEHDVIIDIHGNRVGDTAEMTVRAGKLRLHAAVFEAVAVKLEVAPFPLGGDIRCLGKIDRLMGAVKKLLG